MLKVIDSYMTGVGIKIRVIYHDADSFKNLDPKVVTQTYGVCYYGNKMVIGFGGKKKNWGLIGGTIEKGETFEDTLKREIQEESNMEVTSFVPIGYQEVYAKDKYKIQLRYLCKVKPLGKFENDPAGSVTEIKLIDPKDYRKYFDWGEIGQRIMKRASILRNKLI